MDKETSTRATVTAGRRRGLFSPRGVLLALAGLVLLLGGCTTTSVPQTAEERLRRNEAVFNRVSRLVQNRYFDAEFNGVDWTEVARRHEPAVKAAPDAPALYAALNGMLQELDDEHTRALSPNEVQERRTDRRVRTGFTQIRVDDQWIVTEVLPGSPADKAGVRPGWVVVARNGIPMGNLTDLRASPGETVRWEFVNSDNQPVSFDLKAELLSIAPLRVVRELGGGVTYLRFDEFNLGEWLWLHRQIDHHRESPGMVLDLRHNGGGHTIALSLVLGEFFSRHLEYGIFVRRSGWRWATAAWRLGNTQYRGKLAVLTGPGTGSAAEIFAAVVQEEKRAAIVGRPSAGAVLGSFYYSLPGGGQLQLSIFDYVSLSGRRLEKTGVAPDIEVVTTQADLRANRDPVLDAALEWLARDPVPDAAALDASMAAPK